MINKIADWPRNYHKTARTFPQIFCTPSSNPMNKLSSSEPAINKEKTHRFNTYHSDGGSCCVFGRETPDPRILLRPCRMSDPRLFLPSLPFAGPEPEQNRRFVLVYGIQIVFSGLVLNGNLILEVVYWSFSSPNVQSMGDESVVHCKNSNIQINKFLKNTTRLNFKIRIIIHR